MTPANIRRRLKQIAAELQEIAGHLARPAEYLAGEKCRRCSHVWVKRIEGRPTYCPDCKSPYWDTPRGKLRIGRPPKKKARRR